jgi:5S rRNA maturation endonuclease (ribonuclease M5)
MMPDKNEVWKGYKEAVLSKLRAEDIYSQIGNQKNGTDGWMTGLCPFHNDTHNSFAFNKETLVWACFAGCGKGSAFDFAMHSSGRNFKDTLLELGDKLGIPRPFENQPKRPPIREELVKRCSESLNDEVRRYLREKRGLSDATIKKYQIGWDVKRQRNTIPIRDERGNLVNIRLYNAKKNPKIINYTEGKWKYGSPARLYGLDELVRYKGKQVIITEGEFDRLLLQQEGLMAVTSTHGCSVFRPEWIPYFKDKDVVIIYDCDKEGQAGANTVLKAFKNSEISSIKNIVLPLKGEKDDKDITDYFHKRGFTGADLQRMIDETPVHRYEETEKDEEIIRLESFTEVEQKELIDKKVQCEITVCGETSEAFHAVEEFRVTFCSKLKKGECFDCAEPIKVPRGAQEYIGSCMSTNVQLIAMLRSLCCRYGQKPSIEILRRTTVKEFFCHQKVNRITQTQDKNGELIQLIDGKQQELMDKKVYYLSSEHPKPGTYRAIGWVKSHPKTQQVTLLIEDLEPQEDDYERFRVEDNIEHLRAFKALEFEEIIEDLRENVTRVYERDELLTAVLLTYCSPRWLHFDHRRIRGWIVTAILGDAGSGKTQTYQAIAEYTGIGDIVSGLTSTRTGLAYALVEHKQKGWQVRIGRYPANTRKLLVVDEVQFIPERDLRTMAKAMEEGFFQVDRVQSSGYESQTRLVLIGNPKRRAIMEDFSFGCQALETIFDPAVIRRTDIAVFTNYGDIEDLSFINKRYTGNTAPKVTPEMLRAVIYWTWNLKPEQVVFSDEATDVCLKKAEELPERYGFAARVPLVTREDMRNKLARLAAGFAVLDGSSNEDFSKLHILPEHVHAAALFIEALYSAENCQLDELSDAMKEETQVTDYDDIERAFLEKQESEKHNYRGEAGHFTQAIRILRYKDIIRREYLAEQVGCSPETLKPTISLLKKHSLIDSGRDGYKKTPKLNKFLKRFLKNHPDFFKRRDS